MNRLIDFSSRFRILKGGKISLVVSAFLGGAIIANAAPSGGVVTSGNATINQSGNITNINQSTQKASINWNDFSIKSNETVNFNQPNSNSITLNRVIGTEKSVIDGALNANGQVWILNSNGILFGKNASVNTAGLLATTAQLSDADFQAGNYNFKNSSSNSVINLGTIKVQNSSYVILAGKEVENGGNIEAVKGKVHLVGADSYSINLNGNSLVNLKVNKGVLDAMVSNSGNILANGGEIFLTTNAVDELLKGVVNNTGIIEANSLDGITGKVELFAHGGEVQVGGTIEAKDGFVETSGKDFKVADNFKIKAKEWLIDPTDITVEATGSTTDLTSNSIKASFIESTLNGGTGVTLQADNNIYVNEDITWNQSILSLRATAGDVNINSTLTANGTAGLSVTKGGDFNVKGKVDFTGSNNYFSLDGQTYTIIKSLADLQNMNNNLTLKYALGVDIDANAITDWTSIGNYSNKFTGDFDGLGHTISKLNMIVDTSHTGLFGANSEASTIRNLRLENINFTTGNNNNYAVGGLIGTLLGTASNISVSGEMHLSSESTVGGIAGQLSNEGTLKNSYSNVDIQGTTGFNYGGIVGRLISGLIENNYAQGNITITSGSGGAGGLIGFALGGEIKNSYASNTITATSSAGGIYGSYHLTTITNSWYDKETNTATMIDSSLGKTKAEIVSAFSTLTSDWSIDAGADVEGYEIAILPYLIDVTKDEDKTVTTLFAGGFGTEVNPYTITNWTQLQNINNSNILTQNYYFKLLNDLNSTTSDYTNLASSTANGGLGWNPIGNVSSNFKGNFDGLGNTIDALTINNPNLAFAGLFISINTANIKNIGLTNVDITGGDNAYIGGLVGYSYNSIVSNSYSTGSVTGGVNAKVGGLVGGNSNASTVSNSYSTASVTGGSGALLGGLVGYNYFSTVSNSYSSGSVTSNINYAYAGGLVGVNLNNSTVSNSYSTASVTGGTGSILGGLVGFNSSSTINNSYYDKTLVTGMADESSYGKTTKELQTLATFGDAGWSIELDETMKKIYPYLTFDENGGAIWKVGKYATALNYILGTQNTTYNGTNQSLTDFWTNTIFGNDGSELVAGTDYKFVYNTSDTTSFKNAGTYNDISIVLLNEDYELDETGTNTLGKFVIAKANATVTANSDSKVYNGSTQTVSGFTASGLVNGETISVLSGVSGATASGTNAGTYTTTLAGTDENYNLTFINGTLTINSAPVVTPPTPMPEPETPVVVIPVTPDNIEKINNIISSITNTTSTLVPANISAIAVILTPNLTIPTTQTVVLINNGSSVRVMSQPIQNQNTTMVTMGELRANQDTNTPNGNSDIRVPVGDNSVIELINGGVNLPDGVEQQFFVVNTENNNI